EKPAHGVTLTKGFWMSETPVTQAAWNKVMGTSPSGFRGDDRPVEKVSWQQAKEYCEKVGGRLPTEAQWEYAARAGTAAPRYGELQAIAWYSQNETGAVKQRAPNDFGLYDMIGNVWEWVEDWYGSYRGIYGNDQVDPKGGLSGAHRVRRGGSFNSGPVSLRAACRNGNGERYSSNDIGFRCVRYEVA
ncbi:MAG: formylglycine-generating enzyme family protein, partial [Tabrizicola sp.]|nr:formylglycine-generating enzyme family protein [Tabrizicola sp.]